MSFRELFQQSVNLSHQERINLARNSLAEIARCCAGAGITDDQFYPFLVELTSVFAGVDELVSRKEHEIFVSVTGVNWDYDKFYEMVNECDTSAARTRVDNIVDAMPQSGKDACLMYGLAFLAADEKITPEEQAFFERIWR